MAGDTAFLIRERVDENQPLRRHDLAIGELAPHGSAIRCLHSVVVGSAHPQIHLRSDHGKTLRSPPLLHAFRIGEAFPYQLARRVELTRDDKVRTFRGGRHWTLLLNWHCRFWIGAAASSRARG